MKAIQQYEKQGGKRKVYCLKTPEFNTSQVCSGCSGAVELPMMKMLGNWGLKHIENPHYVRKCQVCQTVFKMCMRPETFSV